MAKSTHSERRQATKKSDAPKPAMILTGQRRKRRHLVLIRDHEVWLRLEEFTPLCILIKALLEGGTGHAPWPRRPVSLLRHAIDGGTKQPGSGELLIETGSGEEFRLTLSADQIAFDPSFRELAGHGFIAESVHAFLCKYLNERNQP